MINIDLTQILQALVALFAALITYRLVPWIKSRTNGQQQANLMAAARVAVFAAEQLYGAGKGEEKLDFAIVRLKEMGFNVDKDAVRESIEAAVYEMTEKKEGSEELTDG